MERLSRDAKDLADTVVGSAHGPTSNAGEPDAQFLRQSIDITPRAGQHSDQVAHPFQQCELLWAQWIERGYLETSHLRPA
jgi:hypothetical protein